MTADPEVAARFASARPADSPSRTMFPVITTGEGASQGEEPHSGRNLFLVYSDAIVVGPPKGQPD